MPATNRIPLGFERVGEIILDAITRWKGAPEKVWNYTLGGYHIVKKCPRYREQSLLHGPLTGKEAQQFTDPARRIATLLQQNPEMDAHYRASSGVTAVMGQPTLSSRLSGCHPDGGSCTSISKSGILALRGRAARSDRIETDGEEAPEYFITVFEIFRIG